MYRNMMVAVDNSPCSDLAVEVAISTARLAGASLTGTHVFAAGLHDMRFRHLEPGLPERYQKAEVLQHQREIHDDLIGRGLRIISDSYLDAFQAKCKGAGIVASRKAMEGRNYAELVRDAGESCYDLVTIGAHGLGRVDRSVVGSVCERVARLVECDLMVVRESRSIGSGPIVVAIDGSPNSFVALGAAIDLALASRSPLRAVAAYDPHFHSVAFGSIAGVLSEESSRLFRFREQERLHDEIIDAGLMGVYRSHLEEARRIGGERGLAIEVEVLEGKPFDAVASLVEETQPALLVVGRTGIHHTDGVTLGSTAENLLRLASCNVLVVGRGSGLAADRANGSEESASDPITWAEEAEARLKRVPPFVRGMVRKRIESLARSRGQREVTASLLDEARQR